MIREHRRTLVLAIGLAALVLVSWATGGQRPFGESMAKAPLDLQDKGRLKRDFTRPALEGRRNQKGVLETPDQADRMKIASDALSNLFVPERGGALPAASTSQDPKGRRPVIALVDGHEVYSYGPLPIYGVSPTFDASVTLQAGNSSAWTKLRPKKSWEIEKNLIGLTPTRTPSSHADEIEPHHPLFFIDDNPSTFGFAGQPAVDPSLNAAWVRVDLPRPVSITGVGYGGQLPPAFEIRVHNWDLWERKMDGEPDTTFWKTVYVRDGEVEQQQASPENTAPSIYRGYRSSSGDSEITKISFEPVTAREVWMKASSDILLSAFEIYDSAGTNIASVAKGCGVAVSRQEHLFWLDQETQSALWQTYYDLGLKHLRLSYYLSPLIWTFAERSKGQYTVDPYLDELITQAGRHGIEVSLTIGPPENQLYSQNEEIEAFCKYAAFLVRHFKGRIKYYEILNEFYNQDEYGPGKRGPIEEKATEYVRVAKPVAMAIRDADPGARIVLSGPCPLVVDFILAVLREGMASLVHVVSWHPYSFLKDTDDWYAPEELDRPRHVWAPEGMTTYSEAVRHLRTEAAKAGFTGEFWANEVGAYAIHADRTTNLISAKYLARSAILHTSLNVPMFWNETTSLLRPPWQPFWHRTAPYFTADYSYYVMRTLCTLLENATPCHFEVEAMGPDNLENHVFSVTGGRKLVALWMREKSRKYPNDDYEAREVTLIIPSTGLNGLVVGTDLLNGRQQIMESQESEGRTVVPGLLVKDYPLLISFPSTECRDR